jgi:hypothetical protein
LLLLSHINEGAYHFPYTLYALIHNLFIKFTNIYITKRYIIKYMDLAYLKQPPICNPHGPNSLRHAPGWFSYYYSIICWIGWGLLSIEYVLLATDAKLYPYYLGYNWNLADKVGSILLAMIPSVFLFNTYVMSAHRIGGGDS